MKDYYKILDLPREATPDEIKQRFKELAFEYHPDVSENKNATDIFIEIYEAYHILSIPEKKNNYDVLHDKFIGRSTHTITHEEQIIADIRDVASNARRTAQQRAKIKYAEFIKESDCFFSTGIKGDGNPFYYNMHKNIGMSNGVGPLRSVRSRTVSIPIPRSKKALKMHRLGVLIKVFFLIILILFWKYDVFKIDLLLNKIIISAAILLTGGILTQLNYILTKTKSKCFHAGRYFLVKKYKKKGFQRGFHPMISTTPVGIFSFIIRWLF